MLPYLPALYLLLTGARPGGERRRRRTRRGTGVTHPISAEDVIRYLREQHITLTCARPQASCTQAPSGPHQCLLATEFTLDSGSL